MNKLRWPPPFTWAFVCSLLLGCGPVSAHEAGPAQTISLVTPGPVKLETVLASFRDQTHLDIQAESCLRERVLLVSFDHVSVESALDAVAELNNWRVTKAGDGSYLIARPAPPAVSAAGNLQKAIRNAVALDLQTYAGFRSKLGSGLFSLPLVGHIFAARKTGIDPVKVREDVLHSVEIDLLTDLKTHFGAGKRVSYSKLSLEERHMLLYVLLLGCGREAWSDTLLTNVAPPHLLDPRNTVLLYNNGHFSHGFRAADDDGNINFFGDGGDFEE